MKTPLGCCFDSYQNKETEKKKKENKLRKVRDTVHRPNNSGVLIVVPKLKTAAVGWRVIVAFREGR